MKKSKSCEEMIGQNDLQNLNENNDLIETTSLQFDNSIDERWHNRFAKKNRQKLISQQQAIDQKVKLTRLEQATKRQHQQTHDFLAKTSTTLKPTAQYQQQPKIYNINEDTHSLDDNENNISSHTNNVNIEDGEEMILAATKLTSHIMPTSSSCSAINNITTSSTTNVSLC
jgi:hypothetical protein